MFSQQFEYDPKESNTVVFFFEDGSLLIMDAKTIKDAEKSGTAIARRPLLPKPKDAAEFKKLLS